MITKLIFGVLCGILYIIGLPFGWNYQETSVYICIHLWPILCILSTIPMLYYSVKRAMLKGKGYITIWLVIIYNYTFILFYCNVLEHYSIGTRFGSNPIPIIFNQCYQDFMQIAASCNTTYEIANLVIYVVLFAIIMITNFTITLILRHLSLVKKK